MLCLTSILQWDFRPRHYLSLLLSYPLFYPFLLGWCHGCFCCVGTYFVVPASDELDFIWYCIATHSPSSASPASAGHSRGESVLSPSILFKCNTLKQLHWLPDWCIQFKLATLIFKALHTGRPPYLTDLLHHQPTRSLRSSSSQQLSIRWHNLSFGSRAFCFSVSWIWNSPASSHSRIPVTSCL